MTEVKVLEQDGVPSPQDFSLPDFVREVFDMYDGHTERVILHCQNEMMKVILDRFGDSVITQPIDSTCFRAEADISVSKTFYAWIFQFGGDIRIVSPDPVLQEYREMLRKSLK